METTQCPYCQEDSLEALPEDGPYGGGVYYCSMCDSTFYRKT